MLYRVQLTKLALFSKELYFLRTKNKYNIIKQQVKNLHYKYKSNAIRFYSVFLTDTHKLWPCEITNKAEKNDQSPALVIYPLIVPNSLYLNLIFSLSLQYMFLYLLPIIHN